MKSVKYTKKNVIAIFAGCAFAIGSAVAFAGHHHGEGKGHAYGKDHGKGNPHGEMHHHGDHGQKKGHGDKSDKKGKGHMMDGDHMDNHMREVGGHGRINKIMSNHHMINIKHEPMPEMNWPQMSMHFKTQEGVDLSNLKPGQEVEFKLLVDEDNNYIIKEIVPK